MVRTRILPALLSGIREREENRQCFLHPAGGIRINPPGASIPAERVPDTYSVFFAIDESQARGPSARVRLSKIAGLM